VATHTGSTPVAGRRACFRATPYRGVRRRHTGAWVGKASFAGKLPRSREDLSAHRRKFARVAHHATPAAAGELERLVACDRRPGAVADLHRSRGLDPLVG
jgi:hypothetical protein